MGLPQPRTHVASLIVCLLRLDQGSALTCKKCGRSWETLAHYDSYAQPLQSARDCALCEFIVESIPSRALRLPLGPDGKVFFFFFTGRKSDEPSSLVSLLHCFSIIDDHIRVMFRISYLVLFIVYNNPFRVRPSSLCMLVHRHHRNEELRSSAGTGTAGPSTWMKHPGSHLLLPAGNTATATLLGFHLHKERARGLISELQRWQRHHEAEVRMLRKSYGLDDDDTSDNNNKNSSRDENAGGRVKSQVCLETEIIFDEGVRQKPLFEDSNFTNSKKYFWILQTPRVCEERIGNLLTSLEGLSRYFDPASLPPSGRRADLDKKESKIKQMLVRLHERIEQMNEEIENLQYGRTLPASSAGNLPRRQRHARDAMRNETNQTWRERGMNLRQGEDNKKAGFQASKWFYVGYSIRQAWQSVWRKCDGHDSTFP
ncbi:hypothetical protein MKZ38_002837 [Zalerion maritima]|uniref:Uncharacterized protein n=1 Tax=Zalerion maritima TaxID=339359 RepID=A0AAD5RWV0_9PEZI|nr:hypothetical protein MKZ38_002837 [Zalerion maritima]